MSLGRMRERLRLLSVTKVSDGGGGNTLTWSTLDTVPAEFMPLKAEERLASDKVESLVESRFRIRVRDDVTPKLRAEWRPSWLALATPKTLEIHGVHPDRNDPATYLLLECGEVAPV